MKRKKTKEKRLPLLFFNVEKNKVFRKFIARRPKKEFLFSFSLSLCLSIETYAHTMKNTEMFF